MTNSAHAAGKFKKRSVSFRKRHANTKRHGRQRFYNRLPAYMCQSVTESRHRKSPHRYVGSTAPVHTQMAEPVHRVATIEQPAAELFETEETQTSLYSPDQVRKAMNEYCDDKTSCISCDMDGEYCVEGVYKKGFDTNTAVIAILEEDGYLPL